MATILLVHGAWHGSWCWAKIVSLLQRDGLNAVTLDLPGRAGDVTPIENLTLERYAQAVCRVARVQKEPVVVVGHSLGGVVITQAAEYEPQRFAKLVYLCAFLPQNGQSLRTLAQTEAGLVMPNVRPDTPKGYFSFREDAPLREIFYHDCSEGDARRAAMMLVPDGTLSHAGQCDRATVWPCAKSLYRVSTGPCDSSITPEEDARGGSVPRDVLTRHEPLAVSLCASRACTDDRCRVRR